MLADTLAEVLRDILLLLTALSEALVEALAEVEFLALSLAEAALTLAEALADAALALAEALTTADSLTDFNSLISLRILLKLLEALVSSLLFSP
mgnify:CR=1 FL=1